MPLFLCLSHINGTQCLSHRDGVDQERGEQGVPDTGALKALSTANTTAKEVPNSSESKNIPHSESISKLRGSSGFMWFKFFEHKMPANYRMYCPFASLLLQVLFTFIVIWISTTWIVSVAPFLEESSLAMLPDYVWPNPAAPLHKWIINTETHKRTESWAICNSSSFTFVTSSPNQTTLRAVDMTHHSFADPHELCLTEVAVPLFFFITITSLLLFVYHLFLVIFWLRFFEVCVRRPLANRCEVLLEDARRCQEGVRQKLDSDDRKKLRENPRVTGARAGAVEKMLGIGKVQYENRNFDDKFVVNWSLDELEKWLAKYMEEAEKMVRENAKLQAESV